MTKSTTKLLCALLLAIFFLTGSAALAADAGLTFSLASGFYAEPVMLEITCDVKSALIYYTTDGSTPDETDTLYTGPITLTDSTGKKDPMSQITGITSGETFVPMEDLPSANVIRAVAVLPDGSTGEISGGTYFIGYDRQKLYGDVSIMSLMIDEEFLFDYDTGIYVLGSTFEKWSAEQTTAFESWQAVGNFSMRGRDWERPVFVEYMPAGEEGFRQNMGVRIKGGASRGGNQKSLRLIAREDYGKKNVKYTLYPDNLREADGGIVEKYKSFTLRNGGNDCDFGKIRDPLIQRLATGLRVETANNLPCLCFINGEYWGMYTLNEEYSDNYFEYHYGIADENIVSVKNNAVEEGTEEDIELYNEMVTFITGNDMADPDNYARACEMLDMGSYVDYVALAFYIHNEDGIFQNNNWQMWRVREPGKDESPCADGKWRMMVFDTDYSSGIYADGKNFRDDNMTDVFWGAEEDAFHPRSLLRALYKNETFKRDLIRACCDVRSLFFRNQRVNEFLDDMQADYAPYMPDTYRRFGPMWVLWNADRHAKTEMQQIGVFFDGRYTSFPGTLRKALGLNAPLSVTIKVEGADKGCVYVNNRPIPITKNFNGKYFSISGLTVTAEPYEGATFVGWEMTTQDCSVADPAALTTELTFTRNCTLTAVFE